MGQHDLSYRQFFSHLRMIRDLLLEIVGEKWVEHIDFDSGELVNTSFIFKRDKSRESDIIWKFRRKGDSEPVYVYVLMEFQSRPDPSMPVRLMVYVGHFYQALLDSQPAAAWRKLPLVVPIVMYTGAERWNVPTDLGSLIGELDPSAEPYRLQVRYYLVDVAAYPRESLALVNSPVADLLGLERSADWADVRSNVHRLRQNLTPAESALRETFRSWLKEVVLPRLGLAAAPPTLEEVETMLAESIDRWNQEIREEGRQEGRREEGALMVLRLLRLKFGPPAPEVEDRVRSADADRLLEWGERVLTAESLQAVFQD